MSVELIGKPALIVAVVPGDLRAKRVADRALDAHGAGLLRPGLIVEAAVDRERVSWSARVDQDRASRGVAPEKQPLGPTQDFDILDIEEVQHHAGRDALVDAVDKHADGGLHGRDGRVRAQAADREIGKSGHRAGVGKRYVGRRHGQILQGADVTFLEFHAVDCGQRDRDSLRILRDTALFDRNDDRLDRGEGLGICG